MKRTYSKATLYRKIKRGTAACLELSQDCFSDNNDLLTSNNNDENVLNAIAENVENLDIDNNDELHSSMNINYFDNLYDSPSQSYDNSGDVINCNNSMYLEHTIVEDNAQDSFSNKLQL